jgi:cyclic lactone autoinducer peptide
MKNKIMAGGLVIMASIAVFAACMPCFAAWHQPKTPDCIA